tara:strand:+ start:3407 stop:3916 length:510 start_codon:yes stop_codon:yes gene_type:complete
MVAMLPAAAPAAGVTAGGVKSSLIGSTLAALFPSAIQALLGQGGALRSQTPPSGTASKFTIPQSDVQALYQWTAKENFRRSMLGLPQLDPDKILDDTIRRNNEALEESARREAYLARVKGEQLNIGQAISSLGSLGQEGERTLQTAINKVLAQDPVGSNQALANLSRGF